MKKVLKQIFVVFLMLMFTGCSGDDKKDENSSNNVNNQGSTSCEDVTTACLANEGSTMYEDVRVEEGGISNLIADVFLAAAKKASDEEVDFSLMNGGAIRGLDDLIGKKYQPGPISDDEIKGWYPFNEDKTAIVTITGAQLKGILEAGVRTWADDVRLNHGPDFDADTAGEFLHPSGLSYEVTCPGTTRIELGPSDCNLFADENDESSIKCEFTNADQANSISKISVGNSAIYENGAWVDGGDEKTFRVVVSTFIADGKDGHLDFKAATNREEFSIDFQAALVEHLNANTPTTLNGNENRIVVTGEVKGLACNLPVVCNAEHIDHENCAHLIE